MRRALTLLILTTACKHEVPALADAGRATPTPMPTPMPTPTPTPSAAADLPAAWLTCNTDADCVALPSECCGAWPSNLASREHVRAALAASDAARGHCKDRVCAMRVLDGACDRRRCVVK